MKKYIRRQEIPVDFKIDFKNYEKLNQFLSDRSKILGRNITGLTAKQQRKLTIAIKRARHLGLLSYKTRINE